MFRVFVIVDDQTVLINSFDSFTAARKFCRETLGPRAKRSRAVNWAAFAWTARGVIYAIED